MTQAVKEFNIANKGSAEAKETQTTIIYREPTDVLHTQVACKVYKQVMEGLKCKKVGDNTFFAAKRT